MKGDIQEEAAEEPSQHRGGQVRDSSDPLIEYLIRKRNQSQKYLVRQILRTLPLRCDTSASENMSKAVYWSNSEARTSMDMKIPMSPAPVRVMNWANIKLSC
ncbi:hypothetical protein ABW20_dc0108555 [Dactylellina cionopaga]|nr:hypothetical protein ABW20_dc0108555 [Dactylellina cionopaga]